jgi:hypothetical protein
MLAARIAALLTVLPCVIAQDGCYGAASAPPHTCLCPPGATKEKCEGALKGTWTDGCKSCAAASSTTGATTGSTTGNDDDNDDDTYGCYNIGDLHQCMCNYKESSCKCNGGMWTNGCDCPSGACRIGSGDDSCKYEKEDRDCVGDGGTWDKTCTSPLPVSCPNSDDPCFAKGTTTACKLLDAAATASAAYDACYKTWFKGGAAEAVLMATLAAGDKVLTTTTDGGLAVTNVIVNQHAATDDRSKMLTLTTSDDGALSLTPEHGLFVDGALAAAADAKVGSALTRADGSTVTVKRITEADAAAVIMPVTAAGTILASDHGAPVLAASHLMKYAPLYKYAAGRAFASLVLYVVGDVTDWTAFGATIVAKLGASLVVAGVAAKALRAAK